MFAEESETFESLPNLSEDKEEAARQYKQLRECARETFQSFLRNLNSQSLRSIENTFDDNDGELDISTFMEMCPSVFPKLDFPEFPFDEEKDFIVQLAGKMLFEDVDVDMSGGADWGEFVNFVCAVDETIRIQAEEGSAQVFDFEESSVSLPYRPQITKCGFDKLFHWPEASVENVVIFEEGQTGFYLHKPKTMQRRKRAEGHRSDLLAATFMDSFDWIVTSGNDKLLCFWDSSYSLMKKWKLETVIGSLCWCPEINALYFAEQTDEQNEHKLQAWRIKDPMDVRGSEKTLKIDKALTINTGHTKSIQQIMWITPSQILATASLDKDVRIFDIIQMQHLFTLKGHTKGLTCLEYCPALQLLLSAGFNNYITLWDAGAGVKFNTLRGHECSVIALRAVPGTDNEILSCDLHGVVKLWDLRRLACVQSFHATDMQAEKAGDIEPLEPRALCPLSRDRVLISGRRMVLFERACSNPSLTADSAIMAIAFSHRKFEIATSVKNNIRIWCALTGKIVAVHNNVITGNITALTLSGGERRCFVGSDNGQMCCINFACGAALKELTPHSAEVSQITCIPDKVLTLSTPEKLVRVHDDLNPEKAVVLKEIQLDYLEPIAGISFNGDATICGGTEDCDTVWLAVTFAKQIASTVACTVRHDAPITCCHYLKTAPLVATSDSDSNVLFWSVQPLRSFQFYRKMSLSVSSNEPMPGETTTTTTVGITSMVFSWPDEESVIVGTEMGALACIDISELIQGCKKLRDDLIYRKDHGEAADMISGKIFDSIPKPCDSPEYVSSMDCKWIVKKAHRGSVDQVLFTELHCPVIISLGFDQRVCFWSPEDGASLGTLEQGMPEGLFYERTTHWNFPIDAHDQVNTEIQALKAAAEPEEEEEEGGGGGGDKDDEKGSSTGGSKKSKSENGGGSVAEVVQRLGKSASSPDFQDSNAFERERFNLPDFSSTKSRLLDLPTHRKEKQDQEWFAGPFAPAFSKRADFLPTLQSGRLRPVVQENKRNDVVAAARRLSVALGSIDNKRSSPDLRRR